MSNELTGFNPVSLMPATFDAKLKMAATLARSGLIPTGLNSPEKVCVALQWGHELQLSPMVAVNNISVINGKPTLSADIMAAVVKRSPEYGGIEWIEQSETKAECIVKRVLSNGQVESTKSTYTIEDAQKAGLTTRDNWKKYPKRMLKHRCQSYALRDMFPDILAGLYTPEEMESFTPEPQERNVTPEVTEVTGVEPNSGEVIENTEAIQKCTTPKDELIGLVNKYRDKLDKENSYGNPYQIALAAIESNDPDNISDKLKRSLAYLRKQGVNV